MKDNNAPKAIKREEYQPPGFLVDRVTLIIRLFDDHAEVDSTLDLRRNPASVDTGDSLLHLDGVDMQLQTIELNGAVLDAARYTLTDDALQVAGLPSQATLRLVNRIAPQHNKSLEGLYLSSGNYCTQCEAQGFRKITWFPDRPDVLSRFTVRIEAEQQRYPVLLSNGNRMQQGELADGRHFALWEDPFPKPCYLFAMIAGDLRVLKDRYTTRSGRNVELEIHVEAHNLDKCDYAMQALKASMAWDEQRYGLEYDLDTFMIVAVDDFNMGAMENKGLNIFNSRFVLANQSTATDTDFMGVESVIAHEYFHNWTGNRVTCRDWFQLSLKEGLTVFRDQQFSAEQNSAAVKRIEDVKLLRLRQFPEDAGPMAHPIRPDEYIEINNFYTVTVYEKGAEVIRMLHTLLGSEAYHAGIDLYFERFDGMAVTCDDFVQAMEDASGISLDQFRRWYSQAGTPQLNIDTQYDEATQRYTLKVAQSCPPTPGQTNKQPFHLPLKVALFDRDGTALPLQLEQDPSDQSGSRECLLQLTDAEQSWVFTQVSARPVPSLLRDFSAPVALHVSYSDDELAMLMANDTDSFNRWEAGQRLYQRVIEALAEDSSRQPQDAQFVSLFSAFERLVTNPVEDASLLAEALSLPGIEAVAADHDVIRVDELHRAIHGLKVSLAGQFRDELFGLVDAHSRQPASTESFSVDSTAIGNRKLANVCLSLLGTLAPDIWMSAVRERYAAATTMTDQIAALQILCHSDTTEREALLADFYARWQHERLVIDKWFSLQALSQREDTVEVVRRLTEHPAFDLSNPNRARSVLGVFASSNTLRFHDASGRGYELIADFVLELDGFNPQVAARLAVPLGRWQRLDQQRVGLMQTQLERVVNQPGLSADVYEIVSRSLEKDN